MSQENVEIVRQVFDAFSRGDLEAVLDRFAPEQEFHPSGRFLDLDAQRVYRGREGWIEFWHTFRDPWESLTISVDRIEAVGDRVLVLGTFHGKGRESGVETTVQAGWIQTLENGLVARTISFTSWEGTLEAAGLSE